MTTSKVESAEWSVLPSGRLAVRISQTGAWVCAKTNRKLCKHGYDTNQINNWLCKRPRKQRCVCTSAKGLWTDVAKSKLPEPPPAYISVLFRDEQCTTLANGAEAVQIPGSKSCFGQAVMVDRRGTRRCEHGQVDSVLRKLGVQRRLRAACLLQWVWRAFLSTRSAAALQPHVSHRRAVAIAAVCQLRRMCDEQWRSRPARCGGKPIPIDCGCAPNGLRSTSLSRTAPARRTVANAAI